MLKKVFLVFAVAGLLLTTYVLFRSNGFEVANNSYHFNSKPTFTKESKSDSPDRFANNSSFVAKGSLKKNDDISREQKRFLMGPEYLLEFNKLKSHIFHSKESKENYNRILADRKIQKRAFKELVSPGTQYSSLKEKDRLFAIDYITEVLSADDSIDKSALVRNLFNYLTSKHSNKHGSERLRKSSIGDQAEIFMALNSYDSILASEILVELSGTGKGRLFAKLLQQKNKGDVL